MSFIMEEALEKWDIIPTEEEYLLGEEDVLDVGTGDEDDDILANVPIKNVLDKKPINKTTIKRTKRSTSLGPKNKSFKILTGDSFLKNIAETKDCQQDSQTDMKKN